MAGKKRGSARQKRRANEVFNEAVDLQIEREEEEKIIKKSEAGELFVLDTAGDSSTRKKILAEKERSKKGRKRPEVQVQNLLAKHGGDASAIQALIMKQKLEKRHARKEKVIGAAKFDLWNEADDNVKMVSKEIVKSRAPNAFKGTTKPVAIELPQGGQSYKPDTEQHQDTIGEALAIEIRRNETKLEKSTPLWNGMSEETLAILSKEADDESDSSDDEDVLDDVAGVAGFLPKKKKGKFTRAERNKQKRIKQVEVDLKRRKRLKQFMHQVNESKKLSKEVVREELSKSDHRDEIKKLIKEKKAEPLGINMYEKLALENPIAAPKLPVALSDELNRSGGASLRTVKTKCNLVHDRIHSMASRKMVNKKRPKRFIRQGKTRIKPGKGREYMLC